MTGKGRLEKIKEKFNYERLGEFVDCKPISPNDLKWLIEQAERAEKLEKENHKLNFEIGSYSGQVTELAHSIGVNIADLKILATRMCKGDKPK